MTLTNKQIFARYSQIEWFRRVYVKRFLANPSYGAEAVLNGSFGADTDWLEGAGWSIAGGKASKVSGTASNLQQDINMIVGRRYRIAFTISNYATGAITPQIGSDGIGAAVAGDGTYTQDLICVGDGVLYLAANATFAGDIDSVSATEIFDYEDDWQDISSYLKGDGVGSISKSLPSDSYSFGGVTVGNANIEFINLHGEMSDESNPNSFFHGYIRHYSQLKIVEGYVDKYTDPDNQIEVEDISFHGLIDDTTAVTTENNTEKVTAKDLLTLLEDKTISDIGALTATTVNGLVYEIMSRGYFTKYFQVLPENVSAGYNTSSIDTTQWDSGMKVMDVLKDLAYGHSIFYVDDEVFYFKAAEPTPATKQEFLMNPERKIKVYDYRSGSNNIIENWYWSDTTPAIKYNSTTSTLFKTSEEISISCITDSTERQNLINYIGAKTEQKLISFKIDLPYSPFLNILDRIKVQRFGYAPEDAFILGIGRLGIDRLRLAVGAVKISYADDFIIWEVKHDKQKTTILVRKLAYEAPALLTEDEEYLLSEDGYRILLEA